MLKDLNMFSFFTAYVNWMSPPAEIIVIKPKEKKENGKQVKPVADSEVR